MAQIALIPTPVATAGLSGLSVPSTAWAQGEGLFSLTQRRLAWVAARDSVLAQNIANIDTPGFQARDIAAFQAPGMNGVLDLARTDAQHLPLGTGTVVESEEKTPLGRAPDGNDVTLETELSAVADGQASALFAGNVWKSYLRMFASALGRPG